MHLVGTVGENGLISRVRILLSKGGLGRFLSAGRPGVDAPIAAPAPP
jgi:hypothetical protein